MKFEVNIEKKYFLGVFVIALMLVGVFAVNAYGTYNPEIFGHTSSEVEVNGNWLIPYLDGRDGSYKLGFEKSDGSFIYVGWEEDNTPQLQFVNSDFEQGVGAGIEVHGDSNFVDSEVKADDFCFNGGCLSELQFKCTYAIRDSDNPDELNVLSGDADAVELWGTPEVGNDDAWWGMECVNGYQKTSCSVYKLGQGGGEYDTSTSGDGQVCSTDDEEFEDGAVVSVGCCTIGF